VKFVRQNFQLKISLHLSHLTQTPRRRELQRSPLQLSKEHGEESVGGAAEKEEEEEEEEEE
jgi:hypothetical protein